TRFPLKTQVKRGMIYNIRPSTNFKYRETPTFSDKYSFIKAIYETLLLYKGEVFANEWMEEFKLNYKIYYSKDFYL
ncbi:hypothetical protein, partial [Psittacicella gerlachiana]